MAEKLYPVIDLGHRRKFGTESGIVTATCRTCHSFQHAQNILRE